MVSFGRDEPERREPKVSHKKKQAVQRDCLDVVAEFLHDTATLGCLELTDQGKGLFDALRRVMFELVAYRAGDSVKANQLKTLAMIDAHLSRLETDDVLSIEVARDGNQTKMTVKGEEFKEKELPDAYIMGVLLGSLFDEVES